VTWPAGVAAVAIWTGTSADTRDYIDRFDAWRAGTVPEPLAVLVEAAGATAAALSDARAFMRQLRAFAARLRAFDEAAALGIHSAAHRRLRELAPDGVVYKPCGAGGGDLGIASALDASVLAAFVARAVAEGYSPLPLELEQDGVQVSIDR
jgi:phosphomevalonate kinase